MRRIAIALTLSACADSTGTDFGVDPTTTETFTPAESSSSEGGSEAESTSTADEPLPQDGIGQYAKCESDNDCPGRECPSAEGCSTLPAHEACVAKTCVFAGSNYAELEHKCPRLGEYEGFAFVGEAGTQSFCSLLAIDDVCPADMVPTRWVREGGFAYDHVFCWWDDLPSGRVCTGPDFDQCPGGGECVITPDTSDVMIPNVCVE